MAHTHAKLVIVGSGPAGYTAAIYAARAMVEPLLISGFQPGGQLMITTDVENYPGFAEAIQGPWLMEQMRLQAEHVGTRIVSEYITKVDLKQRPFRLEADSGETYSCDALIIATGAQAKWLGIPSEAAFQGGGVSACATCDGFFFRGKEVVGGRRRQHRGRGGALPRQHRQQGHGGPPPRQLPRRADPAGAPVQASERRGAVAPRDRRDLRRAEARADASPMSVSRTRARARSAR